MSLARTFSKAFINNGLSPAPFEFWNPVSTTA
jgi:hypothetical protein